MYHDPKGKCPITNSDIPHNYIWTDHNKKGLFNSCGACSDPSELKTLKEINEERKLKEAK